MLGKAAAVSEPAFFGISTASATECPRGDRDTPRLTYQIRFADLLLNRTFTCVRIRATVYQTHYITLHSSWCRRHKTLEHASSSRGLPRWIMRPSAKLVNGVWLTDTLTLLLTSWKGVLLGNVTGPQLDKKFPTFNGIRVFITTFTWARYLSLSWARSIQSIPPSQFLMIHFNINLPSIFRSSKWPLSLRPPNQNPVCTSAVFHNCRMPHQCHKLCM